MLNKLRDHWSQKLNAEICNYFRARYPMILVKPCQGLFNYQCYFNAVEYALAHDGISVVEVVYINGSEPILHYINYDVEQDTYLETTLGFRADYLEYYLLRTIHPDDYKYIGGEFDRAIDSWSDQFITPWRRFLGLRRVL